MVNKWRIECSRKCLCVLGLCVFLFTHTLYLNQVPGLHFDEAWSANYAAQIATAGFPWNLEAMSPYTAPWVHWITAFFFKVFSINLFTFRAVGVLFSLLGAVLLSGALKLSSHPRAAAALPWILAVFVPSVTNHRFFIEITTFHVFCFGLLCFGLALSSVPEKDIGPKNKTLSAQSLFLVLFAPKGLTGSLSAKQGFRTASSFLILVSIFFGVTSHILFLAPTLALLLLIVFTQKELNSQQRTLITLLSLLFLPYFIRIALTLPEKDKAIALLVMNGLFLVWVSFFKGRIPFSDLWKHRILRVIKILTIPSLGYLLFFSQGDWSVLFTQGWIKYSFLRPFSIFLTLAISAKLILNSFRTQTDFESKLTLWFTLTLFILELIILKPTTRYYETGFLFLAVLLTIDLTRKSKFPSLLLFLAFLVLNSLQLSLNYLSVGRAGLGRNQVFGTFFLKDRSTDHLSKWELIQYLIDQGCGLEDIQSENSRLMESLKFLSIGDWKLTSPKRPCTIGGSIDSFGGFKASPITIQIKPAASEVSQSESTALDSYQVVPLQKRE